MYHFEIHTGDEKYAQLAVAAADGVLIRQRPEGYWDYPNPEWRGRIATVEGCFGALGLIDGFDHSGDARFLEGALRESGEIIYPEH